MGNVVADDCQSNAAVHIEHRHRADGVSRDYECHADSGVTAGPKGRITGSPDAEAAGAAMTVMNYCKTWCVLTRMCRPPPWGISILTLAVMSFWRHTQFSPW